MKKPTEECEQKLPRYIRRILNKNRLIQLKFMEREGWTVKVGHSARIKVGRKEERDRVE